MEQIGVASTGNMERCPTIDHLPMPACQDSDGGHSIGNGHEAWITGFRGVSRSGAPEWR
jgi:hypothetical protein